MPNESKWKRIHRNTTPAQRRTIISGLLTAYSADLSWDDMLAILEYSAHLSRAITGETNHAMAALDYYRRGDGD